MPATKLGFILINPSELSLEGFFLMYKKDCPLCKLSQGDIKSKLYYQDEKIIVIDCLTHIGTPMVVLKDHRSNLLDHEFQYVQDLCRRIFPEKKFRGTGMTQIKDH